MDTGEEERKGRPKGTWRRVAKRALNKMGWKSREAAARAAADRQKWNDMCFALCSTMSKEDK